MTTHLVTFLLFHVARVFSTDYEKRFLVTKRPGNTQLQMKIGANDSELTCATFLKKWKRSFWGPAGPAGRPGPAGPSRPLQNGSKKHEIVKEIGWHGGFGGIF